MTCSCFSRGYKRKTANHKGNLTGGSSVALARMTPLWALIPGWILAVLTVVGNGLVIFLITTRRNLRTTTNWFVLSLAVADFGVGAVWYPRVSFCSIRDETCVNEAVEIAYLIGVLSVYASVTNLCVLTLDRYFAIVHPLRYVTFMTKKRVAVLVSAAWGVASTISAFLFLYYVVFTEEDQQIIRVSLFLCQIAIVFGLCIFLLFATIRIFLIARRIARQNATLVAQLNFNHKLQHGVLFKARETASAKMIGIVVTAFLVCYLLLVADNVLLLAKLRPRFNLIETFIVMVMLNSAVNPVAYSFYKREIKTELKKLWFRCSRKQKFRNELAGRGRQREIHELKSFRNQILPTD